MTNSSSPTVTETRPTRRPAARALGKEAILEVLASRYLPMAFQPVVDIRTGRVRGAEALARFASDPYRAPDAWFAEAEACGLGLELECLAVRCALASLDRLDDDTYLAVNVSPRTLLSGELRELVASVRGPRVVLELTEHAQVRDYDALRAALSFFRAKGMRLAIDDAGSGYASFQHILELRPDIIKLDRKLTTAVDSNPVKYALASALVTFATSLGARICAEGVETGSELVALQRLGVQKAQGFYLARPGPLPLSSPPAGLWFSAPTKKVEEPSWSPDASPALKSQSRLAALRASRLWDSPPEEEFDRFTRLATRLLHTPVALLSLVDDRRQYFKSAEGLDVRGTPLSHSFCAHVVTGRTPLVVDDSSTHPLVAGNPVIAQLGVAAYAGVPIFTGEGEALGSFCAVDNAPRRWTDVEIAILQDLAHAASDQIELRSAARSYRASDAILRSLFDALDVGVFIANLDLTIARINDTAASLLMHTTEELVGKPLSVIKHPEDLALTFAERDALLAGRGPVAQRVRFVREDNQEVRLALRASVVRDEAGNPQHLLATLKPDAAEY